MGIIHVNRSNKKPKRPKSQTPDLIATQSDILGYRILFACCMVAAVGSLLLLAFFFSSDVGSSIATAKATHASVTTPKAASIKNDGNNAPDIESVLRDPNASREKVADLLNRMSDKDFLTFVERFTERAEAGEAKTAMSGTEGLQESLAKGELTSKSEALAYLNKMNETEFTVFMKAVIATLKQDSSDTQIKAVLDEVYAEAEALHPGQIDGSKRLKLIEDLNAIDYLYYVAEEGDTLIKLSRSFQVPLGQLVELNGIHDADVIPAGMILLFPSDTEQPDTRE